MKLIRYEGIIRDDLSRELKEKERQIPAKAQQRNGHCELLAYGKIACTYALHTQIELKNGSIISGTITGSSNANGTSKQLAHMFSSTAVDMSMNTHLRVRSRSPVCNTYRRTQVLSTPITGSQDDDTQQRASNFRHTEHSR